MNTKNGFEIIKAEKILKNSWIVLVERTHKTFPVQPDYVGLSVATTLEEHIYVELTDTEITGAYLI